MLLLRGLSESEYMYQLYVKEHGKTFQEGHIHEFAAEGGGHNRKK